VILVVEHKRDRASDGETSANAADDPSDVCLDLLPPAAAMSSLAPREVAPQVLFRNLEPRGQALDDHGQLRTMRFPGGQPPQH
jgi:hypothetical protein